MKPIDTFILYQFIRRLSRPFSDWKMFEVGLIDAEGNFIVPADQRTPEQISSYSYFDMLILNLKKLLAKIPGGSTRIATFAAALYLLREGAHPNSDKRATILSEQFETKFDEYVEASKRLLEDEGGGPVPANNSGGGEVAKKDNPMNVSKMLKRKHGLECTDAKAK